MTTQTAPTAAADQQQQHDEEVGPRPCVKEVQACQFSSWYDTFANIQPLETTTSESDNSHEDDDGYSPPPLERKNITLPSVIIRDLPETFRDYLLSDGVRLPSNTQLSSCADVTLKKSEFDVNDDDDDDWSQSSTQQEDAQQPEQDFDFTALNDQIESILKQEPFSKVNGAAFPKLNWSAPRDASWMNGGSMKCTTPGDIYLLVKASDFCLHDVLYKTLKECQDDDEYYSHQIVDTNTESSASSPPSAPFPPLQLVLRKWCNLHPSMEFRCFVRQHSLIAISQRNHSQHYPHLKRDWPDIRDKLDDFFEDYIRLRYANGEIGNYVVDLYIDQKDRIWIIDFNCWSFTTDALLFEWPELMSKDQDTVDEEPVEMRIVETGQQVRADPLSSYKAPIDTVDLASMTQGDAKQFEDFMKMCQKPSAREADNDSDDD